MIKFRPNAIGPEVKFRNQLLGRIKTIRNDIQSTILPVLKRSESQFIRDSYIDDLERAFSNLKLRYSVLNKFSEIVSNQFVDETNTKHKDRFYQSIDKGIGIDVKALIQNEGIENDVKVQTKVSTNLINKMIDDYIDGVEDLAFNGVMLGNSEGEISRSFAKVEKKASNKAKLIARNESAKFNALLNQKRQENLGIEEYLWQSSEDNRVRPTHIRNNGKVFRWDDPPKDTGHPGHDINCRCVAQAIIKL